MQLRVGIHTGEVTSGVVGIHLPRFKLFGENVCTAARLESAGAAGRVHCSSNTASILQARGYVVEKRGLMQLKGLQDMETYWVLQLADAGRELQRLRAFKLHRGPVAHRRWRCEGSSFTHSHDSLEFATDDPSAEELATASSTGDLVSEVRWLGARIFRVCGSD